jgi:hypothetical protein
VVGRTPAFKSLKREDPRGRARHKCGGQGFKGSSVFNPTFLSRGSAV